MHFLELNICPVYSLEVQLDDVEMDRLFISKGRVPKKKPYFLWSFAKPPPRYGLFTDKKNYPYFSFGNKITNG